MEYTKLKTITKADYQSIYYGRMTMIGPIEDEVLVDFRLEYPDAEQTGSVYKVDSETDTDITFEIIINYK